MVRRYTGEFTVKNRGQDHPARVVIYGSDSTGAYDMILSSDPVVITWEKTELIDSIHGSQMRVQIITESNGQYRDMIDGVGKIYAKVEILIDGEYRLWWCGILADATWEEDFSRERGYVIDVTFSDFNFLDRLDYGDISAGSNKISVKEYIELVVGLFTPPDVDIASYLTFHDSPDANIQSTSYIDLLFYPAAFPSKDMTIREALDAILAPLKLHIMQFNGAVHVFPLDYYMAYYAPKEMSGSLESMGTDAIMSMTAIYRRISLRYDQGIKDTLAELSVDESDVGIKGPWAYIGHDKSLGFIVCGEKAGGLYGTNCKAVAYRNNSAEPFILFLAAEQEQGNSPFTIPNGYEDPDISDGTINSPELANPILYFFLNKARGSVPDYPDTPEKLHVTISLMLSLSPNCNPFYDYSDPDIDEARPYIFVSLTLTPYDGSERLTYDGSAWSSSGSGFYISGSSSPLKGNFVDISFDFPAPPKTGMATLLVQTSSVYLSPHNGVVGGSYIYWYMMKRVTVTVESYLDTQAANTLNVIEEDINDMDGDLLEKEFVMGTPEHMTVGTRTNYIYDGAIPSKTLLERYADFLKRNYVISDETERRKQVEGSFKYNHFVDFIPIFNALSVPLASLNNGVYSFFMKSEEWHLREGLSNIVIEEFNSQYYQTSGSYYLIVSPSELSLVDGSEGKISIRSNVSWTAKVTDGLKLDIYSGYGNTEITVTASDPTLLNPPDGTVTIQSDTTGSIEEVTVKMPAADLYVTLDSKVIQVPWGTQPEPVGVQSNAETFEVSTSNAKVHAEMSEDNSQLLISVDEGDGGRDDLGIIAIVNVTGRADGHSDVTASLTVVRNSPGFILEATKPTVSIPRLTLIGSKYSVEFRTNGVSPLRITAGGTLMQYNNLYLYKKNANDDSYVSVKKLEEGENEIAFSDNTADRLVYFSIMNATTIVANTDPIQRAAAFSVKVSAPDEEDKTIALMMTQEVN